VLAQRVAALAGLDATPFVRAVHHVRGDAKLSRDEAGEVLTGYLTGIERLNAYLDRYLSQQS
jgi:ABC-type transport system involved in cytochrome bd biosynthesis fused ATPase/permease subunit